MATDQPDQPEPTVAELQQRITDLEAVADRRLIELRWAARELYATEVRRQSLGWTGQSTAALIAIQHRLARAANEGPRPADHFEHCARALAHQLAEASIEYQAGPPGWVQSKAWVPRKVEALLAQDAVAELLGEPQLTAVSEATVAAALRIHPDVLEALTRAIDTTAVDTGPSAAAVRSATSLRLACARRPEIARPLLFVAVAGGYSFEWHHVDRQSLSVEVGNDGRFTVHRLGLDGTDEGSLWDPDLSAGEAETIAERIATILAAAVPPARNRTDDQVPEL